jgi:5,10-methylenetetrahydromethanopterin reductase
MIRSSVNLIPEAPVTTMVALARHAEQLGFERVWVYDEGLATRDVHVTMTAIALATERVRIGPGITNGLTRHPAQTAAAIATLDELSGGRAFLGVGAGGSLTLGPLGIDRTAPLTTVRETVEAARALFSGQAVTYDGATLRLRDARIGFARPDIEIWLAGRGPKMLELGGAACDGVMLDFIHKDTMQDYVDLVHRGAERTGNRPQLCYSTMVVTEHDSLDHVKPHMTYRLVDSPPKVKALLGLTDTDVDGIRAAMAHGLHAAAELVRDEWVEPFVIAGAQDSCARELRALMGRHGLDEFMMPVLELDHATTAMSRVAAVLGAPAA